MKPSSVLHAYRAACRSAHSLGQICELSEEKLERFGFTTEIIDEIYSLQAWIDNVEEVFQVRCRRLDEAAEPPGGE